jgi:predicted lysophospholipase L1 biosynthesis ABC-type transport system permease subunit
VKRWIVVGGVGVLCGSLLGWLFHALTGALLASLVIGGATAAVLVVLAVAGARYNRTYQVNADRAEVARQKRARVRKAIEDTQRHR